MENKSDDFSNLQKISILIFALLGFLFDGYDLLIYSYTLSEVKASLNLNYEIMGLIASLMLFATLVGAVFFGYISDKYGRKKGLILTIGTYGVTTFLTAFSNSALMFSMLRIIAGFGIGGEWGIGFALLSETWNKWKGLGGGILQSGFSMGAVLAIFVSMFFIINNGVEGWRYVYMIGGIPSILIAFIRILMPESIEWKNRVLKNRRYETIFLILKKDNLLILLLALTMTFGQFFMSYATIIWWPTILQSTFEISPSIYSLPLMVASAVQIPILFFVGFISDKIGRKITAIIFTIITIISLTYWLYAFESLSKFNGNIWLWPPMLGFIFYQTASLFVGVFGIWFGQIFNIKIKSTLSNFSYMFGRGIGGAVASSAVILLADGSIKSLPSAMIEIAILGAIISMVGIMFFPEIKKA
ncbi:MAG: MFS transporter [Thermoplasmata archaeon]